MLGRQNIIDLIERHMDTQERELTAERRGELEEMPLYDLCVVWKLERERAKWAL